MPDGTVPTYLLPASLAVFIVVVLVPLVPPDLSNQGGEADERQAGEPIT